MVRSGRLFQEETRLMERIRGQAVGQVSVRAHKVLWRSRGYSAIQTVEIRGS